MNHPSSLDLESYACGEPLRPALLAHVEACEACSAFVADLRGLAADGPTQKDADDVVARALAMHARVEPKAKPVLAAVPSLPESATPARDTKRRVWMIATSVITPLAAAAAILLLLSHPPPPATSAPETMPNEPVATAPRPPDKLLMGVLPPHAEPDTTFKGGMQIAVVRERGRDQTRFSSTVRVKAGDRLRVEVALDHEQAILGAVLGDDGSYLELMPEGVRGAGTYFSERSARIDDRPTRGTIVIGSPEAVARARATKQLDGVATLRVEWEQAP